MIRHSPSLVCQDTPKGTIQDWNGQGTIDDGAGRRASGEKEMAARGVKNLGNDVGVGDAAAVPPVAEPYILGKETLAAEAAEAPPLRRPCDVQTKPGAAARGPRNRR